MGVRDFEKQCVKTHSRLNTIHIHTNELYKGGPPLCKLIFSVFSFFPELTTTNPSSSSGSSWHTSRDFSCRFRSCRFSCFRSFALLPGSSFFSIALSVKYDQTKSSWYTQKMIAHATSTLIFILNAPSILSSLH